MESSSVGLSIVAAVLTVVFLRLLVAVLLQLRLRTLIFHRGDWPRAKRLLNRFGWLYPPVRPVSWLAIAEFSGKTDAAVKKAERLIARTPNLHGINICVTAFINAGRYQRALAVAAPSDQLPWRRRCSRQELQAWALVQVNAAEAEYNLGRWDDALRRLERMRDGCVPLGIVKAGDWQQRAWILVHLGRCTQARAAVANIEIKALPPVFHAEYHFTLARIALEEGATAEALACVERGLGIARRASSVRNGVFLRARIRAAAGDVTSALEDYESAAAMTYRGQGGDGLLSWGDLLRSLGRESEARRTFELAIERDGESDAARRARERVSGELPQAAS